ncbi:SusC/RagA family TonB-linked outer membrane protein [Sphingobacterium oryzagri]|uniref:SusC/RagA family TonB-linked outer membrane protein n=1 Tax=Sphingobacterium oryzagri TaxID=3025669 RepID=A0ABY7WLN2_9SPHI|nr:SusC/RagA family TonB-linked outer membrane protein [Sphingobacterium sp. KACC 22765]WDF70516.1 SusC/RagA family TonB-linked outer membrane protein [Sphingobacterium sp. KACC 22765]
MKNTHDQPPKIIPLWIMCLLTLLSMQTYAQQVLVSGIARDAKGNLLAEVNVLEKNSKNVTKTDIDGRYQITVKSPSAILVFSFVGYVKQEHTANASSLDVNLQEDGAGLEEVVVLGYQQVNRKKVTSAVTTIKGKEIENIPYPTFDQMLQGRVAGLTALNTSGEPGASGVVNIRGSNSVSLGGVSHPLYVIDGMIYDVNDMPNAYGNNPLVSINPNDIESIDVLKDAAAAAIYGSRGANGVIMVTTKAAKAGAPPRFNFNFYQGLATKPTLRNVTVGAAERRLKMDLLNGMGNWDNLANLSMFLTDSLNNAFNNHTDWQGIFIKTAPTTNVDASVEGSSGSTQYRLSMGYYNEEGSMVGYGLRRLAPKLNLTIKPFERVSLMTTLNPTFVNVKHGFGDGTNFPFSTWSFPSSFWKLTDEQRKAYRGEYDSMDEDVTTTILSNTKLNIQILEGLNFTSSFSYTYNNNRRDWLHSRFINGTGADNAYHWANLTNVWEIENYLNWTKDWKEHNFNIVAGQQAQRQTNKQTSAYGIDVTGNTIFNMSPGNDLYAQTYVEERSRVAAFGRFNYDYKGKYIFSSSYRRDASSRYNISKRWTDFYSFSVAYNMADEAFFARWKETFNQFKWRASYGVTGNDPANYYAQYNLLSSNATYYNSSFGLDSRATTTTYNGTTVISPNYSSFAGERNLTWEKYPQLNVGIDLSLFNSRVNINADWYVRDAKNIYYSNLLAPTTSGYSYYSGNVINLRNTGVEFTLNADILPKSKNFQWSTTFTLGINDNYITKLPNGGQDLIVGPPWMQQTLTVGKPLFNYRVWEVDGVYATDADVPTDPLTGNKITMLGATMRAGDPILKDQNGDYKIDENDKVDYGSPNARITGGWVNTFSYKGVYVSVLCSFIQGRRVWNGYTSDKLNGTAADIYNRWGVVAGPSTLKDVNYWTGPGDTDAEFGNITNTSIDRWHIAQSHFVEDGSFLRIKNIMLGYTLPNGLLEHWKIKNMRLFGMIDNVYLLNQSTLPDPEAVQPNGYSDGNRYPLVRKYTLGLNFIF